MKERRDRVLTDPEPRETESIRESQRYTNRQSQDIVRYNVKYSSYMLTT